MTTSLDDRQVVNRAALPMAGSAANASLDTVFPVVDSELAKLFEDRNVFLTQGGTITFTGTTVVFTEPLKLELNSLVGGGSPQIIDLGATTRTISADGKMIYAIVDRIAGTATVYDDATSLPAVDGTNQEVFLIAKRVDTGMGQKRLYWRDGMALNEGQTSILGASGTGGTTFEVDQVAHGFSLLTPIYWTGTVWAKALSSDAGKLGMYIVVKTLTLDHFTASNFGVFEINNSLNIGEYYFTDGVTAGDTIPTEPMTGFSNPVFFVESATRIHATCYRPSAIGDGIVSDSDIGAIMAFPNISTPSGYLFCDGRMVSRVTYSDLYNVIGTKYGTGDGSTTFGIPDLRGWFLRGQIGPVGGTLAPAAVNTTTDTFTLVGHNFNHSGYKVHTSSSVVLPAPLAANTDYYVIYVDANNFKLATTLANALAGTAIDITSQGSGVHTFVDYEDPDTALRYALAPGGSATYQDDIFKSHRHTIDTYVRNNSGLLKQGVLGQEEYAPNDNTGYTGGSETRAKNMAVGFFIRYSARAAVKGDSTPAGIVSPFAGISIPAGYLGCDGSSLLRADYPSLFAAIGTIHGSADATHFNLPDYRGKFLRGVDNGAGNDPDTLTRAAANAGGATGDNVGSVQADQFQAHVHSIQTPSGGGTSMNQYQGNGFGSYSRNTGNGTFFSGIAIADNGGNETRPKNAYVNYIIKT